MTLFGAEGTICDIVVKDFGYEILKQDYHPDHRHPKVVLLFTKNEVDLAVQFTIPEIALSIYDRRHDVSVARYWAENIGAACSWLKGHLREVDRKRKKEDGASDTIPDN